MYEIADIQLAFDNDCLQSLLQKRGTALKAGKFDKAKEIQQELTDRKNARFKDLTIPRYFYCTFHTEYALHKAVEVNTFELLG